jgi:O-antigen ligase/Flp pilus assembly protein TadD
MTVEKTLRWIALAGIFALPFICLFVAQSLFFPFITGKNFAFRIIVEITLGAWLALALVRAEYRPRRSWILAALALFVLIIGIADISGVNPLKSLWSNYERMDGWITIAHLLAYVLVASSLLNTEKLWRRLWQTTLSVSAFVSAYGLLQVVGIFAFNQSSSTGLLGRIDATFGNPIYLAVYMLFHIFIAAFLFAQMWAERPKGKRSAFAILYGSVIVLDTIILFLTGTRGTMLGLVGGVVLAVLLFSVSTRSVQTWRIMGALVAVLAVLTGGIWLLRDSAVVKRVGFLDRLATISLSDSTIKSRFMNMGMAFEGFKERPILGWGEENYAIVFDKYYDPQMFEQEPWFDRVHNVVFDWLVAGGLLGLLGYLSIFACTLWCLWKRSLALHGHVFTLSERSILTGLLAGYFFHNLFVFDNVTSYILLGSVLAYVAWREGEARRAPRVVTEYLLAHRTLPIIVCIVALFVWGIAWSVNARALAANRLLIQAIGQQNSDALKNLDAFKQSIALGGPGLQEAREQLAQIATRIGQSAFPVDVKQKFFDAAVSEMQLQMKVSPLDARFPLFLGVMLDAFGDFKDAAVALERAHELTPSKQSILYELGFNAQARGDKAAALKFFETAYNLEKDNEQARLLYAAAAVLAGQDALADDLTRSLVDSGSTVNENLLAAYVSRGQYGKIVTLLNARIAKYPEDTKAYLSLAATYYKMGNASKAIETLRAAEVVAPASKTQIEGMIEQVRTGTVPMQ